MQVVAASRVKLASQLKMQNVEAAARACRRAGLWFGAALAMLEMESAGNGVRGGRNVYGHDKGGALSGFPYPVNLSNFRVFHWLVFDQGQSSNGVGPCQITYKPYFPIMAERGLQPWTPEDNMFFGFELMAKNLERTGNDFVKAGAMYNGGPNGMKIPAAAAYGQRFATKEKEWKRRFEG